jgi:hypothetical protein
MNEKIKELALEADIHFSAHHQHSGVDTAVVVLSDLEKFAELVVEKCIASLQVPKADLKYLNEYNQGWVRGRLLAIENIKKDFEIL